MYKDGVKDILEKLDHDMVGLIPVKSRVREIAALLVVDKLRRNLGLDTSVPSLHMCFYRGSWYRKNNCCDENGSNITENGIL